MSWSANIGPLHRIEHVLVLDAVAEQVDGAGQPPGEDLTNASRTMLMNLSTLDSDDWLLPALGILRPVLPQTSRSPSRGLARVGFWFVSISETLIPRGIVKG